MSARKSHPTRGDGSFAPLQADGIEPTRVRTAPPSDQSSSNSAPARAGPPDENATQVPARTRLDVIAGPDAGKSHRLHGVRIVVGRSSACDLRVADSSVSRRHLEFVVSDECVLVRDLGSGNGTRVNGQRIDERVLRDQDEIAIGRTRFRFVDELAGLRRARPAPATPRSTPRPFSAPTPTTPNRRVVTAERVAPGAPPRPRRRRGVLIAGAVLAVAVAAAIAFAIRPVREAVLGGAGSVTGAEQRFLNPPAQATASALSGKAPDPAAPAAALPPEPEVAPAPSATPSAALVAEKPQQAKPTEQKTVPSATPSAAPVAAKPEQAKTREKKTAPSAKRRKE
jgi:pSer/pThr/pTyr-binding forkhead associated (FHA) protein